MTCLDGVGKVTIDGVKYILHEGDSIVMPAKHPHAVYGEEQFKDAAGGDFLRESNKKEKSSYTDEQTECVKRLFLLYNVQRRKNEIRIHNIVKMFLYILR